MFVDISALTGDATGGSAILSYNLAIDNSGTGSGSYSEVVGESSDSLATTIEITGLTSGQDYALKYRAKNIHGWGDYSAFVVITLAEKPGIPTSVQTANNGVNVDITWVAPSSNGGSTITGYAVYIKQSDNSFSMDSSNCAEADVLTCSVPMSVLTASPFSLSEGDSVEVYVKAKNTIDYSDQSSSGTFNALAQVVPHAPTSAPVRDASTTATNLVVDISSVSQTGGSAITSYNIEWDQGTGVWASLKGQSSDDTTLTASTAATSGGTYNFRYQAKNIHGFGDYSPEL